MKVIQLFWELLSGTQNHHLSSEIIATSSVFITELFNTRILGEARLKCRHHHNIWLWFLFSRPCKMSVALFETIEGCIL